MAKKVMRRLLPDAHALRGRHPWIDRWFGALAKRDDLWHINRHSISLGLAIGLFCAFLPIPMQMVFAAILAFAMRANFVLSVVAVWISNPFTITPIYYFCYRLGLALLGQEPTGEFQFEWTLGWFKSGLIEVWRPFALGCLTLSCVSALSGYFLIRLYWRYSVIFHQRGRRKRASASKP